VVPQVPRIIATYSVALRCIFKFEHYIFTNLSLGSRYKRLCLIR
jgi:hypothetical protein